MSPPGDPAIVDEEDDSARARPDHPQTTSTTFIDAQLPSQRSLSSKGSKIWYIICHHLARHAGAGVMASVAYFDP